MKDVTFITGNQSKADYLAKYLGMPVQHRKIDLDEIQSLDLHEIVEHKVRQAFQLTKSPVIVEDVSLEFAALGRLPGPFIKFFVEELDLQDLCDLTIGKNSNATARCTFGYYDGVALKLFDGALSGTIAPHPAGSKGFGWDQIFIPDGYSVTRASLSEADDRSTYLQLKPFAALKSFLETHNAPRSSL